MTRRAVLVVEYEIADDAPVTAFSDAASAAIRALPEFEGVTRAPTAHVAIDAPAAAVLAIFRPPYAYEGSHL